MLIAEAIFRMRSRIVIVIYLVAVLSLLVARLHEPLVWSFQPVRMEMRKDISHLFSEKDNVLNETFRKILIRTERILFGEKKINADQMILVGIRIAKDSQVWLDPSEACSSGFICCFGSPIEIRTNYKGTNLKLEALGYPTNRDGIFSDWHGDFETYVNDD